MNLRALAVAIFAVSIGVPFALALLFAVYLGASVWHDASPNTYAMFVGMLLMGLAIAAGVSIYKALTKP